MSNSKADTAEIDKEVEKHYWTPKSDVSLDDFLSKSKPSMVQRKGPGTDWIWVAGAQAEECNEATEASKAVAEGTKIFETLQARLKEIQDDPVKYPTRGKKGVPSAKACRDEAAKAAVDELKTTALKHYYTTGKWMFFAGPEYVDSNFATLARSIVHGPLSKDGTINLCKVATSDPSQEEGQHVICCYMDNIWDVEANKRVLKIMASQHGLIPSSAKPDLYTIVGISGGVKAVGMASSIGTPAKMMEDEGGNETLIKLREAYHKKGKVDSEPKNEIMSDSEDDKSSKAKTGEKREAAADGEKSSKKSRPTIKKTAKQVEKENDIFGGSDSD